MKYLKEFNTHASYEDKINIGGSDLEIPIVSYCDDVSDVHYNPYNTVEFYVGDITPPQTVSIYTNETNHIDVTVSEDNKWYSYVLPKDIGLCAIENRELLGDDGIITKVIVKANINYHPPIGDFTFFTSAIPSSTIEASFKGSNTSNVTDMNHMFDGCTNLISLDISGWNTSKVTIMRNMFNGCKSLTSLNLSNFNTSNVTDMGSMFYRCSSLTSLTLSGWVISDATNTNNMFSGCDELKEIKMVGCNQTTINKIAAVKPSSATIIP